MELVVIFGPPAVGKMTVGHELCRLAGYRLSHNHLTVEPIKDIFDFGTPPYRRLVDEFRRRIIEEAVSNDSDIPGLVQTFVWGLELPDDGAIIESWAQLAAAAGAGFHLVELYADRATRLARNDTDFRREHKRSHRNRELSTAIFHDLESSQVMSTGVRPTIADPVLARLGWLRIDNSGLAPEAAARRIRSELGLSPPSTSR